MHLKVLALKSNILISCTIIFKIRRTNEGNKFIKNVLVYCWRVLKSAHYCILAIKFLKTACLLFWSRVEYPRRAKNLLYIPSIVIRCEDWDSNYPRKYLESHISRPVVFFLYHALQYFFPYLWKPLQICSPVPALCLRLHVWWPHRLSSSAGHTHCVSGLAGLLTSLRTLNTSKWFYWFENFSNESQNPWNISCFKDVSKMTSSLKHSVPGDYHCSDSFIGQVDANVLNVVRVGCRGRDHRALPCIGLLLNHL